MAKGSKRKTSRKRRGKANGAPVAWAFLMVGALVFGVLAAVVGRAPSNLKERDPRSVPNMETDAEKQQGERVQVLKPTFVGDDLRFESRSVPKPAGDEKLFAVNSFLDGLDYISKDARAKKISVASGLATIDFDPSFDRTFGTADEQVILNGILTALGQFNDVQSVSFTVQGRPIETLGNVDLTEPQPVIRPTAATVTERKP